MRCRTADRFAGAPRGVEILAPLVGNALGVQPRFIGTAADVRETRYEDDLRDARGCLLEAGGQVDDALAAGDTPLLLAADCSVSATTLPAAIRNRPDARILWLDAHGDYNTPATSGSGYLGGMCLAAATVIGASPVETLVAAKNALDGAPVFVHLDLDVLDPEHFPAAVPAANGLHPDKLYDLADSVLDESELLGLEITNFAVPDDDEESAVATETAMHVLEPFLDHLTERS